jgi:hypothetical protein
MVARYSADAGSSRRRDAPMFGPTVVGVSLLWCGRGLRMAASAVPFFACAVSALVLSTDMPLAGNDNTASRRWPAFVTAPFRTLSSADDR